MTDTANSFADGLRELADFVEPRPELFSVYVVAGVWLNLFADSREEFAEKARDFGDADKIERGDWYILRKRFGPHGVDLNIRREKVCTRVQVGTRTVSAPDPEAAAALPLVETEEPVYEWQCPDSILRPTQEER